MNTPHVIEQLVREGAVPLYLLAREVPSPRGRHRTAASLARWATVGVRGLRLEAFHDGTRWYSSRPALARFLAGQTAARMPGEVETTCDPVARRDAEQQRQRLLEMCRPRGTGKGVTGPRGARPGAGKTPGRG